MQSRKPYTHDAQGSPSAGAGLAEELKAVVETVAASVNDVEWGPEVTNNPVAVKELSRLIFELTDHLGNVRTTFTPGNVQDSEVRSLQVHSLVDYYPFGSQMPGRSFSSDNYRYGFQGQEKDDEVAGRGNSYTAEFWKYDSRLGRRWNLDPKPNPSICQYATFANNPILFTDPLGDTIRFAGADEEVAFNEYRDKVFGSDKYSDIQEEILALEGSETDFRLRTGDNATSDNGGGNTKYNNETGEIDINFDSEGEFSEMQVLSHELKNGHQFLEGKIGFMSNGKVLGVLADYQDEYEAYQRQNRFAGSGGKGYMSNDQIHKIIRKKYPYPFRATNKSLNTISSGELNQMINVNKLNIQHGKKPFYIINTPK